MGAAEGLLKEFDLEMASTRKTLARIPEDKVSWKPHEKSMGLGRLAGHLAELPGFGMRMIELDGFNLADRPQGQKPLVAESQKHVLEIFDKNVDRLRAAIAGTSDEDMQKNWMFAAGDKKIYDGSRIGALRRILINHMIHH
ncbi:MAG: DinB family protein, partial [Candidatus Sulfotelmatobacter sp.]